MNITNAINTNYNSFKGHYRQIHLTEEGSGIMKKEVERDETGEISKIYYVNDFMPNGLYSAQMAGEEDKTANRSESPCIAMRTAIRKSKDFKNGSNISGYGFDKNRQNEEHKYTYNVYFADPNEKVCREKLEIQPEYIVFPKGSQIGSKSQKKGLFDKIKSIFTRK